MLEYLPQKTFGAQLANRGVHFCLWAPNQDHVSVVLDDSDPMSMSRSNDGWHELMVLMAKVGTRYKYRLQDGLQVPDPASRFQPDDVHGPSEVIDPHSHQWGDGAWTGRRWEECVIYELHIGAFTQEGTFRGAIVGSPIWLSSASLHRDHAGPDFPGSRNWGYDCVLLFAPDSSYGRPDELKALVDAAHARKMMVFLDVVYNHFGPDGNYLPAYSPIFTEHHETPWGAAVNYDSDGSDWVREFVIQNAIYWISEFHLDGLRLDAVHAIKDDTNVHILDEPASQSSKCWT